MLLELKDVSKFQEVLANNEHVVLDFYSTDCPPCARLAPIFSDLSEKYSQIPFVKIMRQDNRELAESYYVMGSPTVLFFRAGQLLEHRLSGSISAQDLEQALTKTFPEITKNIGGAT